MPAGSPIRRHTSLTKVCNGRLTASDQLRVFLSNPDSRLAAQARHAADRLAALLPTADRAIGDPEQAVKLSTDLCAPIVAVQPLSGCYEFPRNHASRRAARLVERPLRHQPPSKRRQTSPSYLVGRIARGISGTPCHLNLPAAPHAYQASCAIPHRAEAALRTAKVPNRPYVNSSRQGGNNPSSQGVRRGMKIFRLSWWVLPMVSVGTVAVIAAVLGALMG